MAGLAIGYGTVDHAPVGSEYSGRPALREAGLHRPLQAGIDFASGQAAASVVLSGVYPDDDRGDDGKDALSNVLCLCPNDHVLFDSGAITVVPETLTITGDRGVEGRPLWIHRRHEIDRESLDYHREAIFVPIVDRPDR